MRAHEAAPAAPHVLVVDDSVLARRALAAALSAAGMVVEVAPDPLVALQKIRISRPDAVVLDILMPSMDGLTFLRVLMAAPEPIPVVMCSDVAGPGTELALEALEQGAIAVVEKPRLEGAGVDEESAEQIREAVRGALLARVHGRGPAAAATPPRTPIPAHSPVSAQTPVPAPTPVPALTPVPGALAVAMDRPARAARAGDNVIVIGASTGGTEALRTLLQALPPDVPGIALVQHMPAAFTGAFARRLDRLCRLEVKEAAQGDRLSPGRVLVAPGNRHLALRRESGAWTADVFDEAPHNRHRPSVDVLFRPVAQAAGRNAIGILLTGMGEDGAAGLLELRRAGAFTIAQDEASCVVFGMPKEAIRLGAAGEVRPLRRIAAAILRHA